MKKLLIVSLILLSATELKAQTYIKANALYYVVGIPNVSVETKLGRNWTFNADAVFSPWESFFGRKMVIGQIIPEVRYYIKEANRGFYAGGYVAADVYRMNKFTDHPKTDIQHGWGMSLGITLGYELPIAKRWLMDFYAGGGWHHGWYWGEDRLTGGMYAGWNRSGEWIPYKLGVAFAYRLGRNK